MESIEELRARIKKTVLKRYEGRLKDVRGNTFDEKLKSLDKKKQVLNQELKTLEHSTKNALPAGTLFTIIFTISATVFFPPYYVPSPDGTVYFTTFLVSLIGSGIVGFKITLIGDQHKDDLLYKVSNKKNAIRGIEDLIGFLLEEKEEEEEFAEKQQRETVEIGERKAAVKVRFDENNNGIIDVVEAEDTFTLLLKKKQTSLVLKEKEFNQSYLHNFVKVGKYLSDKKKNLQSLFTRLQKAKELPEFNELEETIKQELYTLNLLTVNTLDMIVSLLEDDRITFYSLYEKLDELGIFTSNYEREMLTRLNDLNSNMGTLIGEMQNMNYNITSAIEDLSYRTEESTALLTSHLEDIDSTMKVGNTLALINTYQNYKTNKRLK